jgi:hypothetical protein
VVCFEERYVVEERDRVRCPVTDASLRRFAVHHEDGERLARFVSPVGRELTRFEIVAAAREAERAQRRRERQPARLRLVGA